MTQPETRRQGGQYVVHDGWSSGVESGVEQRQMEMVEDAGASRGTEEIRTTGSMVEGATRVAKT